MRSPKTSRRETSKPSPASTAHSVPIAIFAPPPRSAYIPSPLQRKLAIEVTKKVFSQSQIPAQKLRGRSRVPVVFYLTALSVSSCLFLLSSLVPWFYSPFHFSWTLQRSSVAH